MVDTVAGQCIGVPKAIRDYFHHHNANPKLFVWIRSAEEIMEKVARARKSLNKIPSA